MRTLLILLLGLGLSAVAAEEESKSAPEDAKKAVKYKAGKELDFESLLIQGQLQRPEIAVVTGDTPEGTDGLLRLRENFVDRIGSDFGEELE